MDFGLLMFLIITGVIPSIWLAYVMWYCRESPERRKRRKAIHDAATPEDWAESMRRYDHSRESTRRGP